MAKQRTKTTQPSDITQTSSPAARKSKPVRRSEEGLRARKESDRLRVKTRINISYSFTRWRKLKEDKKLRTDGDVADYLLNFYEKRASISLTSTGTCTQEPTALSSLGRESASERGKQHQQHDVDHQSETTHMASEVDGLQDSFEEMEVTIDEDECNSVKNRLSDLDSDMENVLETTELSAPGADGSCDEDVYVPIIPQRSTSSELLLECEEEELEPWQKQTLHVHLKEEDDVGELSNDQTDCKPEPSLLQRNAGFIMASHQLTSNTEFTGSLGTPCRAENSFTIVPATIKTEDYDDVHTSEVHQIINHPVSSSSVQSPAATSSNQQHSDQSDSQTLSVPLSCFTVLGLEFTDTSNKQ